jgi:RimJ/RimL family protein N-acetyltransferase
MTIQIRPMTESDIPRWLEWAKVPHVKEVWFIEGYETTDYIYEKIKGNGYDFPFIIEIDNQPVGYLVCCDLFAYKTICESPKGLFIDEPEGTFCMDLFIADQEYLNKGYGTEIVKLFSKKIFDEFKANIIYIDPAATNKHAIRCYEKTGFKLIGIKNDGVTECYVMAMLPK